MTIKKRVLAATALFAAATLGACTTGDQIQDNGQGVIALDAGLRDAHMHADACVVKGKPVGDTRYFYIAYDFKYSIVTMDARVMNNNETTRGYSVHFNTVTNPAVKREITAAYDLLPATANCPKPAFAPASA